jgi:hypothetical protein
MVWEVIRPISKKPEASAGRACGIQSHSRDESEWGCIKESLLPLHGATRRGEPETLKSTPFRAIPQARPAVRWVFCYYARECLPRCIDRLICPRQISRLMVWEVIRSINKKPEASAGRARGAQSHSQEEPEWDGIKESLLPLHGATMKREPEPLKSTPFGSVLGIPSTRLAIECHPWNLMGTEATIS